MKAILMLQQQAQPSKNKTHRFSRRVITTSSKLYKRSEHAKIGHMH